MGLYSTDKGTEKKDYPTAPPGPQQAVLADVEPLGIRPISYQGRTKMKPRVALYFLSEYKDPEGRPISIRQEFNDSLHEKANLRKFLEDWRGRKLTAAECKSMDPERLIGVNAQLNIVHNVTPHRTYANIASVMAYRGDSPLHVPADFVRRRDRVPHNDVPPPAEGDSEDDYTDSPF